MARVFSVAVVGVQFANKRGPTRRFAVEASKPGDPVDLRLEPRNPKDANAVAVFTMQGVQMGYLRAEQAGWIGGMMRSGREVAAVFQGRSEWGAWLRIGLDGAEPLIPAPDPSRPQGDANLSLGEWQPDPEYDDVSQVGPDD